MLRWIVGRSIRYRYLTVFIPTALMVFGVFRLQQMPVDVFPEFAPPRVAIQTSSLGLSAEEVEQLITVPIEQALNGIDDVAVIRSKSVPQLSEVVLIFEPDADLIGARQQVQERLQVVTPGLPTWAAPPFMLSPLSSTSRTMKIGITSDKYSLIDLSMTTYWHIREHLLRVPGVANVAIWGEQLQMMQVQVDPALMVKQDVSLNEVMEVTAQALDSGLLHYSGYGNTVGTGGFIETPNQRLAVRHKLPIVTPADLARVVVAERDGRSLTLGDIAAVKEDHQPLWGDSVINDGPGLMLIIEKFPWGNTLDVTNGVEKVIEELKPGLDGVNIDTTIFRPATFIQTSIDNLTGALLLGAFLVIVVIALFLFEWRAALISVVAIPLSLVAAGLVLYSRGATINVMVLAGFVIALGDLVDDAIIDVENIVRRLRIARAEGSTQSLASIILDASLEVRSAIVYATLISVLALLPVFLLEGLSGSFFRPLATSYALALLASMVVAMTVTPALCLILLRNAKLDEREAPVLPPLKRFYRSALAPLVRNPKPAYGAVALVALVGVLVTPALGQELLPSFKERDFLMHWLTRPGTSQPEMRRITTAASKELRSIPGVRNFGAHIGQALIADEVVGIDFGENWISVDENVDYDQTVASIQATVDGYPGLQKDVQTYLKERIREVLTGAGHSIVVRVSGPELAVLREKADEIEARLHDVKGLKNPHVTLRTAISRMDVEVDVDAAEKHGLKPGDVRRAMSTLLSGEEVGDIFRHGRAYDVVVWSLPTSRDSLNDVENMLIDTPSGERVRMKDVAEITIQPATNGIDRENATRRLDVSGDVDEGDLGTVARDVDRVIKEVQFPLGYHAAVLGEFAERQSGQARLLRFGAISMIGVLILLYTSFGSVRLAALSAVLLPSALVGGILAAYATGAVVSLGSLVGFFTVLGVSARNGIMLISHYQHLEHEEGMAFGPALALRGAEERLSPILMTSLASALALVPLLWAGNIAGHEIEYPMAIVIMGGLITSTFLNLLVVPSLYLQFGRPRPAAALVSA